MRNSTRPHTDSKWKGASKRSCSPRNRSSCPDAVLGPLCRIFKAAGSRFRVASTDTPTSERATVGPQWGRAVRRAAPGDPPSAIKSGPSEPGLEAAARPDRGDGAQHHGRLDRDQHQRCATEQNKGVERGRDQPEGPVESNDDLPVRPAAHGEQSFAPPKTGSDAENNMVYAQDLCVGKVAGIKLDPATGEMKTAFVVDDRTTCLVALVGPKEKRVMLTSAADLWFCSSRRSSSRRGGARFPSCLRSHEFW